MRIVDTFEFVGEGVGGGREGWDLAQGPGLPGTLVWIVLLACQGFNSSTPKLPGRRGGGRVGFYSYSSRMKEHVILRINKLNWRILYLTLNKDIIKAL